MSTVQAKMVSQAVADAQQKVILNLQKRLAELESGQGQSQPIQPQVIVQPDPAQAAEIARLQEENRQLRAAKASLPRPSMKVGEKGGVSVYNLGRFPVTLTKTQWRALLERKDDIRAFITAHDAELKTKH